MLEDPNNYRNEPERGYDAIERKDANDLDNASGLASSSGAAELVSIKNTSGPNARISALRSDIKNDAKPSFAAHHPVIGFGCSIERKNFIHRLHAIRRAEF